MSRIECMAMSAFLKYEITTVVYVLRVVYTSKQLSKHPFTVFALLFRCKNFAMPIVFISIEKTRQTKKKLKYAFNNPPPPSFSPSQYLLSRDSLCTLSGLMVCISYNIQTFKPWAVINKTYNSPANTGKSEYVKGREPLMLLALYSACSRRSWMLPFSKSFHSTAHEGAKKNALQHVRECPHVSIQYQAHDSIHVHHSMLLLLLFCLHTEHLSSLWAVFCQTQSQKKSLLAFTYDDEFKVPLFLAHRSSYQRKDWMYLILSSSIGHFFVALPHLTTLINPSKMTSVTLARIYVCSSAF